MNSWDVFVSHASEDKASVARPLANKLKDLGLRVWLDEYEIRIGDSLTQKLAEGLANAAFGVVLLSPNFFAKTWTKRELGALLSTFSSKHDRVLPVRHGISAAEVTRQNALLADMYSLDTEAGLDAVAAAIFAKIALPNVAHTMSASRDTTARDAGRLNSTADETNQHEDSPRGARLRALELLAVKTVEVVIEQEPTLLGHLHFIRQNLIRAVERYFDEIEALRKSRGAVIPRASILAHTIKWVHLFPVLGCDMSHDDLLILPEEARQLAPDVNDMYITQLVGYFLQDLDPRSTSFRRLICTLLDRLRSGTYSAPMAGDWLAELLVNSGSTRFTS